MSVALLCLALLTEKASGQWISPAPQGNRLYASTVIGDRTYFLGQSSVLLRTDDAGNHIDELTPYTEQIERGWYPTQKNQFIAFTDSLHGFISAQYWPRETNDGGRTWFNSSAPMGYGPIYFVSPRHGWKASGGVSYRTTDGGVTWAGFPLLDPETGGAAGFAAIDSLHVWVMASTYVAHRSDVILYSSNGGLTWDAQQFDWGALIDAGDYFALADIHVNPSGLGLATGYRQGAGQYLPEGVLFRTTNFGASWNVQLSSIDIYRSIVSVSDSLWILFGNNLYSQQRGLAFEPSILRSVDFGMSWRSVFRQDELPAPETGAWIPSQRALLASGYFGVLYRSMDLGLTWEILGTRVQPVRDVAFLRGTDIGIAPGDSSSILRSTNRGTSWVSGRIDAIGVKRLKAASAGGNTLWVGGERGVLLRSVDRGGSWERIRLPYDTLRYDGYSIESVSAFDSLHVAVCLSGITWGYDRSMILFSADGGAGWFVWEFPEGVQAKSVDMYSETGIAAGGLRFPPGESTGRGFIAQSSDFGRHWRMSYLQSPVVTVAANSDLLCLAGTYGGGSRTTDGGATWLNMFPTNEQVTKILFDAEGVAWLIRDFKVMRSLDQGSQWTPVTLNLLSDDWVTSMAFSSSGTMFFVDMHGAFLATTPSTLLGEESPAYTEAASHPLTFSLSQNYPNPFNPATTIEYSMRSQGHARMDLFNILGEYVRTLVDEDLPGGRFRVEFNAANLPSGTYFYRLRSGSGEVTRKLLLIR